MPRLVPPTAVRYKFLRKNLAVLRALTNREWEYVITRFPPDINDVPQKNRSQQLSYLRSRFSIIFDVTYFKDDYAEVKHDNHEMYELADYTERLRNAVDNFAETEALLNNDSAGAQAARDEIQRRLDIIAANC